MYSRLLLLAALVATASPCWSSTAPSSARPHARPMGRPAVQPTATLGVASRQLKPVVSQSTHGRPPGLARSPDAHLLMAPWAGRRPVQTYFGGFGVAPAIVEGSTPDLAGVGGPYVGMPDYGVADPIIAPARLRCSGPRVIEIGPVAKRPLPHVVYGASSPCETNGAP